MRNIKNPYGTGAATVSSAQAGSGASLYYYCSATGVDHLVSTAPNTTRANPKGMTLLRENPGGRGLKTKGLRTKALVE